MLLHDAGLGTKVETGIRPESAIFGPSYVTSGLVESRRSRVGRIAAFSATTSLVRIGRDFA